MAEPTTVQGWLDVARERGADAGSMLPERASSIGPTYMAGYAVESALKALLQARGIPRPRGGAAGHDLRALWRASGLKLRDIKDNDGSAAFFVTEWSTALRYEASALANQQGGEGILTAANRLVAFLTRQARRHR